MGQRRGPVTLEWLRSVCIEDVFTDCLVWVRSTTAQGYGTVSDRGRVRLVHRIAYELAHDAEVPSTAVVLHECDNPPCCNPAHLRLGTVAENNRDMMAKGRHVAVGGLDRVRPERRARGPHNGSAKLTEEVVREIFTSAEKEADLAAKHGVSLVTVSRIRGRRRWQHLTQNLARPQVEARSARNP